MEETLKLLRTIIDGHDFQKMPEWNENGEFIGDARAAVSLIREVMSLLNEKYKDLRDLPGLSYNINLIQHATNRIDEMIKESKTFNKMDLVIFHHCIEYTIKEMISDPKFWNI